MKKVTIILPAYNEAGCIEQTFDKILEFSRKKRSYHFLFVNDGSTDNTQQILEKKLFEHPHCPIELLSYSENRGKGYAIKKGGVYFKDADFICFLDSDLAYSLEHLELLVDKLEKFDMVIGCRNLDKSNFRNLTLTRKLFGKVFNLISRKILGLPYLDMQAGLKGFRKELARELFKYQKVNGFSFDVELIFLAHKKGYSVGEIPAKISEQHLCKTSKVNLIKDSLEMFACLLKIRFYDLMGIYE